MLAIEINQGNAFFQQRVELEGTNYVLDFSWVTRAGVWTLAVMTDEAVTVVSGIAIVTNRPLLKRFHYLEGIPPGELLYVDPTGSIEAPGFDTLTELTYFTAAEWRARAA